MPLLLDISSSLARRIDAPAAQRILKEELGANFSLLIGEGAACSDAGVMSNALAALFGSNALLNPKVRKSIIEACPDSILDDLIDAVKNLGVQLPPTKVAARRQLATQNISPGSNTAFEYCRILGFPSVCAGAIDFVSSKPPEEVIGAYKPLNQLHPFQLELSQKIQALLEGPKGRRAMVSLPTGAGKTRTIVDTILRWKPLKSGESSILWVAQHEELCEQAIACLRDVWQSAELKADRDLRVQRVWDSKSPGLDWSADVIVGIPESLSPRLAENSPRAQARLGAIVIDEAHLTAPRTYDEIFEKGSYCIIIGLSATPENPNDPKGTLRMVFDGRLLVPDELGDDPVAVLTAKQILSRVTFEPMIACDVAVREQLDERALNDFSESFLDKVGKSPERQRIMLDRLLAIGPGVPTLCFAPSVRSARALSAAMAMRGRSSAYVDYGVTGSQRRQALEAFRSGTIQFLFNYQVLATGFDAPRISCLMLGRPTRNRVLYEQMIGRGMRGPQNGGTESCLVLYFEDQFSENTLNPRSYASFSGSWQKGKP